MNNTIFDTEHLTKTYFKLALPVVLGLVVTLIYNLADTFFIARTENTALVAGVSICSPIFTTLMGFGNIFGQGGSSLISRFLGQNDREGIRHVSSFCFYIAIAVGLILAVLMGIFHMPLLHAIGATAETFVYARQYFLILALGAPIIVLSFIHSNLVRCEGMASQSMIGTALGAVLNIILDPILISGLQMGAAGAAIATVAGYLFSDLYFLVLVRHKSGYLSMNPGHARVTARNLYQILGVGTTAALTNLMQSLSIIVMNHFLLPYGSEKIAAMGIVLKINMIPQLILTGFAFGGVPLFGYLYGAGNKEKQKELTSFALKFMCALSIFTSALVFVFAPALVGNFMNTGTIVADGAIMLRWQVVSTVFVAVLLLMTVIFQATGQVGPAFILSLSRQGVVFLLVLIAAAAMLGYDGILMSQAISDVVSAGLALGLYVRVMKKN